MGGKKGNRNGVIFVLSHPVCFFPSQTPSTRSVVTSGNTPDRIAVNSALELRPGVGVVEGRVVMGVGSGGNGRGRGDGVGGLG